MNASVPNPASPEWEAALTEYEAAKLAFDDQDAKRDISDEGDQRLGALLDILNAARSRVLRCPVSDLASRQAKLDIIKAAGDCLEPEDLARDLLAAPVAAKPEAVVLWDQDLLTLGDQFRREHAAPHEDDPEGWVYRLGGIASKISAQPATTLDGVLVKAQAYAWCRDDGNGGIEPLTEDNDTTDYALASSIMDDLFRLSSGAAVVGSETPLFETDAELIELGEHFRRVKGELRPLEEAMPPHADPDSIERQRRLYDEEADILDRSRKLRATTDAGRRVKAWLAFEYLPNSDVDRFDDVDHELVRSVLSDVLGFGQIDIQALQLDDLLERFIAGSYTPWADGPAPALLTVELEAA